MAIRANEVRIEVVPARQLALFDDTLPAPPRALADLSVPSDESGRSNGRSARLTLGEAARIIREAVKDKSYRKTPLGQPVATCAGSATSTARRIRRSATTKRCLRA